MSAKASTKSSPFLVRACTSACSCRTASMRCTLSVELPDERYSVSSLPSGGAKYPLSSFFAPEASISAAQCSSVIVAAPFRSKLCGGQAACVKRQGSAIVPVPMDEPQILVEELEKRFGETQVLKGVNMRVERSEVAVIIGGSGAGKTTLLRVLIGLERPTSGRVVVAGVDIAALSERELNNARRKFGMVFQYSALLDSMNVLDNVAFPLREHSKLKESEIKEKVLDKLKAVGL